VIVSSTAFEVKFRLESSGRLETYPGCLDKEAVPAKTGSLLLKAMEANPKLPAFKKFLRVIISAYLHENVVST
jgi:hypothetical protein